MTIHGSNAADTWVFNDGMRAAQWLTENSPGGLFLNDAATAEITFDTGAQSADTQVSGVRMNAIPKDGGKVFSGTFVAYGAGNGMQSDNRTPQVKALIGEANHLAHSYEMNPAFGGPMRNKLWFLASAKSSKWASGNAQYAEIGPARNVNFGLAAALRVDPNLPRDCNLEESVLIS